MKVWVDQDSCTGDGLRREIAPAVFTLLDDGLACVKEGDNVKREPGAPGGVAIVANGLEDVVAEPAEECPRVRLHRVITPSGTLDRRCDQQVQTRGSFRVQAIYANEAFSRSQEKRRASCAA